MTREHPIREFIRRHLGNDFSSEVVWDSVKNHHNGNSWDYDTFECVPCQTFVYPCDRLREVAAFFSDAEGYDEDWTPK